jgi:hypothetical protein
MNAAKVLLFPKLASIYDKLCQTCIRLASADPQIFGSDINVGSEWIRRCHTKGGATQEQLFRMGGWGKRLNSNTLLPNRPTQEAEK